MGTEVFFSYSHRDEALRDELAKHLSILKRQGTIESWYDRDITAGSEWAGEIDAHLNSAQVILLLISADFLASDYCYDIELKRAMERHEAGEAVVVPIILKPVDWRGAPFGKLNAFPKNALPITAWPSQDEAFLNVAQGIRKAVEALATRKSTQKSTEPKPTETLAQPLVSTLSGLSVRQRQRLETERDGLQENYDLLQAKLRELRKALTIETDPSHRFKLTKQTEQTEAELDQLDQQLEAIETKLQSS
jgi:TIR domain/Effector-associated domain 9